MYFPLVEAGHLPDSEFLGNLAGYLLFGGNAGKPRRRSNQGVWVGLL